MFSNICGLWVVCSEIEGMERVEELVQLNETTTEQVNPSFFYVTTTKPERCPRGSPAG